MIVVVTIAVLVVVLVANIYLKKNKKGGWFCHSPFFMVKKLTLCFILID